MPEVIFNGPAGRIEGRYHHSRKANSPIALVLHPHPQFGGTMNNPVTYTLFQNFVARGFSVLRFNFRGVGRSQGAFDGGIGELSDAASALDWLQSQNADASQCWIGGFSFGAWIAIGACGSATMTTATYILLNSIAGRRARSAIGALMLVTGLSGTVFVPLGSWLVDVVGWRGTCTAYACILLLVTLPMYLFLLPTGPGSARGAAAAETGAAPEAAPSRATFALVVAAIVLNAFVTYGFASILLELLNQWKKATGARIPLVNPYYNPYYRKVMEERQENIRQYLSKYDTLFDKQLYDPQLMDSLRNKYHTEYNFK